MPCRASPVNGTQLLLHTPLHIAPRLMPTFCRRPTGRLEHAHNAMALIMPSIEVRSCVCVCVLVGVRVWMDASSVVHGLHRLDVRARRFGAAAVQHGIAEDPSAG